MPSTSSGVTAVVGGVLKNPASTHGSTKRSDRRKRHILIRFVFVNWQHRHSNTWSVLSLQLVELWKRGEQNRTALRKRSVCSDILPHRRGCSNLMLEFNGSAAERPLNGNIPVPPFHLTAVLEPLAGLVKVNPGSLIIY